METKAVWDKESIHALLDKSDIAVIRGLQALYKRQTAAEQSAMTTKEHNGVGFNAKDAKVLSDIASRLPYYNNKMTARQTALVRDKLKKYWRQLAEIANESAKTPPVAQIAKPVVEIGKEVARLSPEKIPVPAIGRNHENWGLY
jgi:hypothetical protein